MTDNTAPSPESDTWDSILTALRNRYPGQKDSILFCLHKLQQNPNLTLPDFRDEAQLHGIPIAGRALHSAKVLLGLATAKPRAPRSPAAQLPTAVPAADAPPRTRKRRAGKQHDAGTIEDKVLDAVRQIQSAAGQQNERLRLAVRQAVALLQRALDEE